MAIKECGYEAIMVNCNPETVSTDFDIADKLYFEPVYLGNILWEIIELWNSRDGVIVQLGRSDGAEAGRRPRRRRACRCSARASRRSTWPRTAARFGELLEAARSPNWLRLNVIPAATVEEVLRTGAARGRLPRPLVWPSYVLGGRAMEIVYAGSAISVTPP